MIPQAFITEWSNTVPWQTNEQIEQDLIICRILTELYSDEFLADSLAFRGGTAIHKLFIHPQLRYSEDIDLVQVNAEPIKLIIQQLQRCLSWLGNSNVELRKDGFRILFRYDSEIHPVQRMRLKVEVNTREHFSVMGMQKIFYTVNSTWYTGHCRINTYHLEEMLGTKLRALYQRRKGRDMYDLYKAMRLSPHPDINRIISCYHRYMSFSVPQSPTAKQYLLNLEEKMKDSVFLGDTTMLLRPDDVYNHFDAFEFVKKELIEKF